MKLSLALAALMLSGCAKNYHVCVSGGPVVLCTRPMTKHDAKISGNVLAAAPGTSQVYDHVWIEKAPEKPQQEPPEPPAPPLHLQPGVVID